MHEICLPSLVVMVETTLNATAGSLGSTGAVTAGWNLIGDPFNAAVSFADITNWDKVTHCYAFQDGAWTVVDLSAGSLEPGAGYWVDVAEATTLEVAQP
jgi:hypothetical protein